MPPMYCDSEALVDTTICDAERTDLTCANMTHSCRTNTAILAFLEEGVKRKKEGIHLLWSPAYLVEALMRQQNHLLIHWRHHGC